MTVSDGVDNEEGVTESESDSEAQESGEYKEDESDNIVKSLTERLKSRKGLRLSE
jgi:hypothetical protein